MRASQLVSEDGLKSAKALGSNNGPAWKTAQPDMSDCKSKDMTDLETRWVESFKADFQTHHHELFKHFLLLHSESWF